MRNSNSHGQDAFKGSGNGKDRKNYSYIDFVRKEILRISGMSFNQFLNSYNQAQRYRYGLKYFTTTNKAICEALIIPVEFGTREKCKLEKSGLLGASVSKVLCPFTKHPASLLTTDPKRINSISML